MPATKIRGCHVPAGRLMHHVNGKRIDQYVRSPGCAGLSFDRRNGNAHAIHISYSCVDSYEYYEYTGSTNRYLEGISGPLFSGCRHRPLTVATATYTKGETKVFCERWKASRCVCPCCRRAVHILVGLHADLYMVGR